MKYIYAGALTLLFVGLVLVPNTHAETTTSSVLEQIKTLMAKIEELQKQLSTIRGELKDVIRNGVAEGMEGDDIKKIQEILATDNAIYPEGKVTGYFGPLTREALKRFQERHGLAVTGIVDEATHDILEEYLKERFGEQVPPGLLRAPGIAKKIELRLKENCDNSGKGKDLFCQKLRLKYEDQDDDSEDDDDDRFDVEIEIEDDGVTVSFTFENKNYTAVADSTGAYAVVDAVAEKLGTTVAKIDRNLKNAVVRELKEEIDDEDDEEEDEDDEDDEDDDEDDEDDEDDD